MMEKQQRLKYVLVTLTANGRRASPSGFDTSRIRVVYTRRIPRLRLICTCLVISREAPSRRLRPGGSLPYVHARRCVARGTRARRSTSSSFVTARAKLRHLRRRRGQRNQVPIYDDNHQSDIVR